MRKFTIRKTHEIYPKLVDLSHNTNNLYNRANFIVRQNFFFNTVKRTDVRKYIGYYDMDKMFKKHGWEEYRGMLASSAQQCLKGLDSNWKGFFAAIKAWKKNPEKFLARPKPPKYKDKGGRSPVIFIGQWMKISNGYAKIPSLGYCFPWTLSDKINQVRFNPHFDYFVVEVVYTVEEPPLKDDIGLIAAIDLGMNNLATLVFSDNSTPMLFDGKHLKSVNRYFNERIAFEKSKLKISRDLHKSNRIKRLWRKRDNIMNNSLHKISAEIVNQLVSAEVTTLIVGHNKTQKQDTFGNRLKDFVQVPIFRLVSILEYKCKLNGIRFIATEENYTSGTSYLNSELPIKKNYDKKRRVRRGLFVTNEGFKLNSDVNGAYQIMRKIYPNIEWQGEKDIFRPYKWIPKRITKITQNNIG